VNWERKTVFCHAQWITGIISSVLCEFTVTPTALNLDFERCKRFPEQLL
jgi:hypothetical protein